MSSDKIVAVDYDETLTVDKCYPDAGKLNQQAIDVLRKFKDAGGCLILWTCRSGDALQTAIDACKEAGLEFDAVNENTEEQIKEWDNDDLSPKIYADFYIDDKNLSCDDWEKIDYEICENMAVKNSLKEVIPMKKFWNIKNEADAEDAEMMIYGQISDETWCGDEVTPQQFAEDLKQCGSKNLTVHVNSPGGDVFAAQAIYTQLKNYSGQVTMKIDGMCASAATVITCAGDKVIMPDNAIFMIHNPSCVLWDSYNANDLQQITDRLEAVKQTIVNVYTKRCGNSLSEKKICQKMDDETWMSAQEALDCGFIDEIDDSCKVKNSLENGYFIANSVKCDLKKYKNTAHIEEILNKKPGKEGEKSMESNDIVKKIADMLGIKPENNSEEKKPDAAAVERKRITDLIAMKTGNELADKIVDTAIENGNTPEQIKPFIDSVPEQKKEDPLQAIKDLIRDNHKSGADGVAPVPGVDDKTAAAAKRQADIDEVVNYANKMRGAK